MESNIRIEEYNPMWKDQYEALKNVYSVYLGNSIQNIEHVGSTAVPNLAAKPILDIDLVIADEGKLQEVIPVLECLGYKYMGDMGIKDRYAFQAISELTPITGFDSIWPGHHLYCCLANSVSLSNHLLLRNALRKDTELAKEYAQLKKKLANTVNDIDSYVEGKSDFIAKILLQEGVLISDVGDIGFQNRKK